MRRVLPTVIALLLLVPIGCSPVRESTEGAVVALVVGDLSLGRTVHLAEAARERAIELGMDVEVLDAGGDPDRLADLVTGAVDDDLDGILVEPLAWLGLEAAVTDADEAGIPVVVVGGQTSALAVADAYVGPDPAELGRVQMAGAVELPGGGARIGVLTVVPRTPYQRGMEEAYQEVLAEHPTALIVHSAPANGSPSQATARVEAWLRSTAELTVVVAQDDTMALAALGVLEEAGRDAVAVVGNGASDDMLSVLLQGGSGGTVWTSPWDIGREAAVVMDRLLRGERVDENTFVGGAEWVDADNVGEFLHE